MYLNLCICLCVFVLWGRLCEYACVGSQRADAELMQTWGIIQDTSDAVPHRLITSFCLSNLKCFGFYGCGLFNGVTRHSSLILRFKTRCLLYVSLQRFTTRDYSGQVPRSCAAWSPEYLRKFAQLILCGFSTFLDKMEDGFSWFIPEPLCQECSAKGLLMEPKQGVEESENPVCRLFCSHILFYPHIGVFCTRPRFHLLLPAKITDRGVLRWQLAKAGVL